MTAGLIEGQGLHGPAGRLPGVIHGLGPVGVIHRRGRHRRQPVVGQFGQMAPSVGAVDVFERQGDPPMEFIRRAAENSS